MNQVFLPRLRGRVGRGPAASPKTLTNEVPKKPIWRVQPIMRKRARALRTDSTEAEKVLWRLVRAHRLNGIAFRRQTPIGPYIADFVSHSAKLVIERDGGQHYEDVHEKRDKRRDSFFRSKGFRVLRFSNHDVLTNREGVWDVIAAAVGEAVAPSLTSPASGGGFDDFERGKLDR
jgi:very-short-patch-repair endonuclease